MTYLISGNNPRAGLRGTSLGGPIEDAVAAARGVAKTVKKTAQSAVDALSPSEKKKKAKDSGSSVAMIQPGAFGFNTGFNGGVGGEDNTMLYVGGGVAVLAAAYLLMSNRK